MTLDPPSDHNPSCSWTETAYDWYQRSRQNCALEEVPKDPATAAWAFVRPLSSSGGTGISFLDSALRRQLPGALPVIDLRGDYGKTWTVISLAARFVVATRLSKFATTTAVEEPVLQPKVVLLDSSLDITTEKLAYTVRSTLLRQLDSSNSSSAQETFQQDMEDCLGRIHIAACADVADWVPILESIRQELAPSCSDHPTLLLWDGFLQNDHDSEAARMEIIRQVARILEECSVLEASNSWTNYDRPGRARCSMPVVPTWSGLAPGPLVWRT